MSSAHLEQAGSYGMQCRRCKSLLTAADEYCPVCKAGPLKELIQLGTMPNGYQINLYLDRDTYGPQIAVLQAILAKMADRGPELPLGTVQRDECGECGEKVYRHADAPWLHVDSGLRWCYRNPDSREVAVPVGPWGDNQGENP